MPNAPSAPAAPQPATAAPAPPSPAPGMQDASSTPSREIQAPEGKTTHTQESIYAEIEALANPQSKQAAKPPEEQLELQENDLPENGQQKPEATQRTPKEEERKPEKGQPPAQLRKAYEDLKAKHAELEKKLSEAPKEDPEKRTLTESLAAREKRIQELEEEQKFYAYERSKEYVEKYQKPYEETAAAHTAKAVKMKVKDEDGESRNLTDKEFWALVGISDDDEALAAAEKLTGNPAKAALLVSMRNDITAKLEAGNKAKEQFKATASEREKQLAEQSARQRVEQEKAFAERAATFQKLNEEAAKKYPKYFAPEDGDEKGNQLLQKGIEIVDAVFGDSSKIPQEKLVHYHSAVRNKAAAFDRMAYKFSQASAKIAELEKELAAFKGSGPGNGGQPDRGQAKGPVSWEQEIDILASRGRR